MSVGATSVVRTIVTVSVVAAALVVAAGSTTTPVAMVGTMIVAFAGAHRYALVGR